MSKCVASRQAAEALSVSVILLFISFLSDNKWGLRKTVDSLNV